MKNNRKNKIDILIERLSIEFAKIPNFELTQTDTEANKLFNFVMIRFSDIQDFKTLYQGYFIPSANKAIVDARNEIKSSYYRKIINISDFQLKENYYDTIRLGYVGLFHKIENFIKDLLIEANLIFNDGKSGTESIEKYYEKEYKFRFNDWHGDLTTNKINWICNCVKHYDGYPKKEPKYKYLEHLSENEKIRINHDEFYRDIDYIANTFYQLKLAQVLSFSVFKMLINNLNDFDNTEDFQEKYNEIERQIRQLM